MKLLALYIKHYRDCFEDICFNFTSEYEIMYKDGYLSITKKASILNNFYGKHITELSLIIGKNGTGKSSILNIIGNTMKERINGLEYSDSKILDRYFLVYLVTDDIFYIEILGNDFVFSNVSLRPKDDFIFSTYIRLVTEPNDEFTELSEDECVKYNSLYEKRLINDRVVYINDNAKVTTSAIDSLGTYNTWLLPRNNSLDISWEHWYEAYIELYKRGIIESKNIRLKFLQASAVNTVFSLAPECKEDMIDVIGNIYCTKESFHDFIAHNINITVTFLLNSIDSTLKDESFALYSNRFVDKWKNNIVLNAEPISLIFSDLKEIIEKVRAFDSKGILFIVEIIDLYKELYLSLLLIQGYIITGIDDFELIINGEEINQDIKSFLNSIDMLSNFIRKPVIDYKTAIDNANYTEEEPENIIPPAFKRTNNGIIPLISQGENNIVTLFSKLKFELQYNINHTALVNAVSKCKPCFLFLIDEVESGMHIEWSRNFISQLVTIVDELVFDNKFQIEDLVHLQFVMTTHSPFIVSDVLNKSIIELSKESTESLVIEKSHDSSFAQNIQIIISDEFYMKKFCGEYALQQIQDIINKMRSKIEIAEDEKERMKAVIDEVGEPIIRNKLKQMYKKYIG